MEVGTQPRANRRGSGKTDALDAVRIARSVLGIDVTQLRVPRADGARNALRILVIACELITREKTATGNALTALVRTQGLGIDARKALTMHRLRQIATWRARAIGAVDTRIERAEATRLARHVLDLRQQADVNAQQLQELLVMPGVGPVTAFIMIVAWSHHERVRSEATFASLVGTCPIPASSGISQRHRLNRGGDRRVNSAIQTIVMVRMGRDLETKAHVAEASPRAGPSARPGAASSDTSLATFTAPSKGHPLWPHDAEKPDGAPENCCIFSICLA